jgi:GT2 family glycosyltransferase
MTRQPTGKIDLRLQRLVATGYSTGIVARPRADAPPAQRVSVVVPCHNYGRFLAQCVQSVLAQPEVDVDVLIVDDASTDDSATVARSLAAADPRVRMQVNPTNLGHIASYNTGLAQVTGEYVLLLSADDMLTPGALARAVRLLVAHPSVGFAYGWSLPFSGNTRPPARTTTRSWCVWHGVDWVADRCRRGSNVIRSSDAVVRRTVLERVGGYRADLPHSGDLEWWLRAALVSDVGMVCGVDQLYYRLHGANMSRTTYASALTNLRETQKAFEAALDTDAIGRAQADELRRTVSRTLARRALQYAVADYMSGEDLAVAVLDEYKAFALRSDPRVERSAEWRALRRREAVGRRRARTRAAFRAREVVRDLEGRAHWRRARFAGV